MFLCVGTDGKAYVSISPSLGQPGVAVAGLNGTTLSALPPDATGAGIGATTVAGNPNVTPAHFLSFDFSRSDLNCPGCFPECGNCNTGTTRQSYSVTIQCPVLDGVFDGNLCCNTLPGTYVVTKPSVWASTNPCVYSYGSLDPKNALACGPIFGINLVRLTIGTYGGRPFPSVDLGSAYQDGFIGFIDINHLITYSNDCSGFSNVVVPWYGSTTAFGNPCSCTRQPPGDPRVVPRQLGQALVSSN